MTSLKTERARDYVGPLTNTDIWDDFELRPDDVIVCTPPKCGTTWMLNIVMMLIKEKIEPGAGASDQAPWLDCAFRDRKEIASFLAGLDRRRCIKTHTPLDGVPYAPEPTYIVVYRHPVDVHFSFRKHNEIMKEPILEFMFPPDEKQGFRRYVDNPATELGTDDLTVASFADHYAKSRALAGRNNVHFFHYAELSRDLSGQIARLGEILNVPLADRFLQELTEANTFASMRQAAENHPKRFHEDSALVDYAAFFNSGSSNKWEGRVSDTDMAAYHDRIAEFLSPKDIAWLHHGRTT